MPLPAYLIVALLVALAISLGVYGHGLVGVTLAVLALVLVMFWPVTYDDGDNDPWGYD